MWNDAVITNAGRELLSRWTTGETLEITRAATGQGTASAVQLMAQTSLVSEKQAMSIVEKGERVANGVRIRLQITSKGVQAAYTINQIGIWARVGSEAEVLVAIYQDATGVRAPSESEMADYIFTFYATIQTTNDGEIVFTVDPLAAVTNDRFQTEVEKLEQADKDEKSAREEADNNEKKAREEADKALDKKIEDVKLEAVKPGTGLVKDEDGRTINHKNAVEAGTASGTSGAVSFGGKIKIPTITYDDTGHVTEAGFTEVTLPASPSFEAPVTSVNGKTGAVTLGKENIGLGNVDNVRQYSTENPPPYPVTSVNKKTGAVEIGATDLMTPLQAGDALADDDTLAFLDKSEGVAKSIQVGTLKLLLGGDAGKYGGLVTLTNDEKIDLNGKPGTVVNAAIVKRLGTGSIMVKSLDENVVTAALEGEQIKLTIGKGGGDTTVAVSVASDDTFTPASVAFRVSVFPYDTTLSENTPDMLKKAADEGVAASIWAVGDTYPCRLHGTVGTLTLDTTLWAYVVGFDHNEEIEGKGIYFGTFKNAAKDGVDVCLVDSGYNKSYTDGTKYFNMNHSSNTNVGGWKSCDLRYDILGSTHAKGADANATTTSSPVPNTLMAAFESELRAAMKPITKYTDNAGNKSTSAENVTKTIDYLPLFAEFEIFGERTYANSNEQNYQKQFDYWKNGNDKKKYRHDRPTTSAWWWSRSPTSGSTSTFVYTITDGAVNYGNADISTGVAAHFAIGS